MSRRARRADRIALASLVVVANGMAVLVSACSQPSGGSATGSPVAIQASAASPVSTDVVVREATDAATAVDPVRALNPDALLALGSNRRDDRTLAAATPYEDRHGKSRCQEDCVQHEAGYKWAALHSLTDEARCAGATPGFIDGCRAYALDHRRVTPTERGTRDARG